MLLPVVVLAGVVALVLLVRAVAGARRRFDDVDRFHVARTITTGWARAGVTRPVLVDDARAEADEEVDTPSRG